MGEVNRVRWREVVVLTVLASGILTGVAVPAQDSPGPALGETQAQALVDAVVRVHAVALPDARTNPVLGRERIGSGILIDARGYVLTIGYLVIEAQSIAITDGHERTVPATLAGYDHATGFAVLRLLAPLEAQPLALGDSAALRAHELVMSVPFGGRAAARLARVVSRRSFTGSWEYLLDEAIFVSPPTANWAGAALISRDLKLVGVGSLLVGDAAGAGQGDPGNMFVPIDILKPILADLIADGKRNGPARPWLGMGTELFHGLLVVTRVSEDGPAAAAGVEPGDVVVAVGDVPVSSPAELYRSVWRLGGAGVKVPLRLRRGAAVREVTVESTERSAYFRESVRQ